MILTLAVRSQTITLTVGALNTSGGGGGGVSVHADLTGRSADDAHPQSAITGLVAALAAKSDTGHTHADATGSVAGFMPAASVTKLAGIATGATANASDADLRARSSHTGTQLAATISDFTSAAAAAAPVQSVAGRTGAVVIVVGDVSGAEASANKAQANGYASLDSGGKVPQAQIPAIAITEYLGDVASQAAMLALSGQKGDWCTRSDTGATWIITGTDPTLLGSWTSVTYPASPVTSVAGRNGAVTISSTDITDSTSAGRAVMTAADAAAIRTAAGVVIGTDVQAYSAVLAGTTASFLLADETKLDAIEALADVTDAGNVGSAINGATEKTTPTGADKIPILDSAAASVLKWMSWTSITTALNALYATVGRTISAAGLATGGGDLSANRTITVTASTAANVSTGTATDSALTPGAYKDSTPFYVDRAADWTLALTDRNKDQWFNNGASALVCTIPLNSSVAFAVGDTIPFVRLASGTATIDAATSVTLNGVSGGSCTISTRYQGALLKKIATDSWVVSGDVSAVV